MAKCCQYCLTLEELSWQDFLIIFVFISEMILQLYPSWSQISHFTKNENMVCNGMPKLPYVRHFWRNTHFGKNDLFEGGRVKKDHIVGRLTKDVIA